MKLGGRERMDDGAALEELFAELPVNADWTIGFMTAVHSGPDAIAPTSWITEIVRDRPFSDDPAGRAKVELVARLYGAVAETLRTTPEIIPPEPDKTEKEAIDFCEGYLHGAGMHAAWTADEAAAAKLEPFRAIARGGAETDHRERLGRYVADLHAHWKGKRQVVNTTPKVGRNDPCPCGSGKKYKKCCLAA